MRIQEKNNMKKENVTHNNQIQIFICMSSLPLISKNRMNLQILKKEYLIKNSHPFLKVVVLKP